MFLFLSVSIYVYKWYVSFIPPLAYTTFAYTKLFYIQLTTWTMLLRLCILLDLLFISEKWVGSQMENFQAFLLHMVNYFIYFEESFFHFGINCWICYLNIYVDLYFLDHVGNGQSL